MPSRTDRSEAIVERYGRRPSRRRAMWLWAIGGAIAVVAVGTWFIWANPIGWGPSAEARGTGFSITEDSVTVSFTRTVTPGHASACAVQALDKGFATVGWTVVTFPPSDQLTSRESVTVRVIASATTGLVESCWLT